LLKRISYEFVLLMAGESMLVGFVFVLAYLFQKRASRLFLLPDSFAFFLTSAIVLFLSANFMSVSIEAYSPLCLDPRHYLFLIPVVAIPAAVVVAEYITEKKHTLPILIGLLLVAVWLFFVKNQTFDKPYLPLLLLFGVFYFLPRKPFFTILFTVAFVGIALIGPFNMAKYAQRVQYNKQKAIVYQQFINRGEKCYVITNAVQKRLGAYYTGFNPKANCIFLSYDDFDFDSLDNRKKYLLLNWHTQYLSGLTDNDLPLYVQRTTSSNPAIYEDKDLAMSIYVLQKNEAVDKTGTQLLHSLNTFEAPTPYWDANAEGITEGIKYQGGKANTFREFSATFNYPLDSLKLKDNTKLLLSATAYLNFEAETNTKFVVSLENDTGAYFWEAIEINRYIKAYSNWWPVTYKIEVNTREIKANSRLKVYLWNEDKKTGYVDDFEVSIYEQL